MKRASGILLSIASLPSKYGIGCFSREAYDFVDFLEKTGQSYWQILPLGQTGYGDSPYQSFSTFAGNPYFIDLEKLIEAGYLTKEEAQACDFGQDPMYVDYEKIYRSRYALLRKAFRNSPYAHEKEPAFEEFISHHSGWLPDYALFCALKEQYAGVCYTEWDEEYRRRDPEALARCREKLAEEIRFFEFLQYLFYTQWHDLKAYANGKGIEIIGDIPIYVAFDSADAWSHPELFEIDEEGYPTVVAGCPPDAFSATGQLWGNPIYRWTYHKGTGYAWWISRIRACFELYDVLRIDHFRGFDEYYAIPYGDETAQHGKWCPGPGLDLFNAIRHAMGDRKIIAEDLGYMTESVIRMVEASGFPNMKVLQFAFDPSGKSEYLPHNYGRNCVAYTGTHDNETMAGWLQDANPWERDFALRYAGADEKDPVLSMIRLTLMSVADTAIIPIQDYLRLGNEARTNHPSTLGGINWRWRLVPGQLTEELAREIRDLTGMYGRLK
ncbi:MAG: 4-alpha-glucanotransferase [Lachnospiraceae bacterium]|nr:4-alpha-glucanotransferase [Lachnospiraceae bacterium]